MFSSSGEEKPAISQPQDVTYELFERGTSRGFPLLLSSDGHSYVVKKRLKPTTYWRCSVRYEGKQCPAGVSQQGETFTAGHFNHSHPSEPTRLIMAKVACQVKDLFFSIYLRIRPLRNKYELGHILPIYLL